MRKFGDNHCVLGVTCYGVYMETTQAPSTFTTGAIATARSACDYDCVWTFEVIKRTAAFVTLRDVDNGDVRRCKIHPSFDGGEYALPFGSFSMAPVASVR